MIDLETVDREIKELEARGDTTYSICERLSWLYIVRDHLLPTRDDTTNSMTGSDFLDAASNVSYPMLMHVIDDHMNALRIVQPREYESVMERIRGLH